MYKDIQKKSDGTFIINFKGYSFHVTPDYPTAEMYGDDYTHAKLAEYATAHPDEVTDYVELVLPQPSDEELKQARIAELESEAQRLLPYIQAGIDAALNQQKLTNTLLEIEELKGNLSQIEETNEPITTEEHA